MIELAQICKIYNEGADNAVHAVRDVSLTIEGNAVTVLKGPSGSGKTSLLSMIGCLSRPSSGRIFLDGDVVSNLPERFLTDIRRSTFGFVFQQFNLIRGLSVLENVMLPAYPLGLPHSDLKTRAMVRLEQMTMGHRAMALTETLSGGEAQRVAIARALINDPAIVIADEPTANLDSALSAQFLDIIDMLKIDGRMVIMTSHDPRIWQWHGVDQVVSMQDGAIIDRIDANEQEGQGAS